MATNESNIELMGNVTPQKSLTSLSEDSKKESEEILADQARWVRHGANHSTKAAKTKSEIMEELSRERFPWEFACRRKSHHRQRLN